VVERQANNGVAVVARERFGIAFHEQLKSEVKGRRYKPAILGTNQLQTMRPGN
jgi:hypothetical protein